MIEGLIAVILLIIYLFKGKIEILATCGIFSIASYLGLILKELRGSDKE